MRRIIRLFLLLIVLFLCAGSIAQKRASAASQYWYGKYWKTKQDSRRYVSIFGKRLSLNGYWKRSTTRIPSSYEEKMPRKTFTLTKYTRYYIQDMNTKNAPLVRVSKTKFKQRQRCANAYCASKIKNSKVQTVVLSVHVKLGPWTITQHGNNSGSRFTFYTLTNSIGDLVIIDGGSRGNGKEVLKIIRKHGSRVKAWILSHSDTDHIGAFISLMNKKSTSSTIKTEKIYIPTVDNHRLRTSNDRFHCDDDIEDFIRILSKRPHIVRLQENNMVDVIGLKMKVYHSWDKNVDLFETNKSNKGALMFMLTGTSEKMLFCTDVEKEMEPFIIENHWQELKADYVQLSHHGNNGLSQNFYSMVEAEKGAFADTPEFIQSEPTETYDGPLIRDWILSRGIPYYCFTSVPNTITLH